MPSPPPRFLVVDDSTADYRVLAAMLNQASPPGFQVVHKKSFADGLDRLTQESFDCAFLDCVLDDGHGLELLEQAREQGVDTPVVVISGSGDEQTAVEALHRGAQDYLVKGTLTPQSVRRALNSAIEKVDLARRLAAKQNELESFAHAAAHDLLSPLRQIVTFVGKIESELPESVDEESRRDVATIAKSAERLHRLVLRLLEYARLGRDHQTLVAVDLNEIAAEAVENLTADVARQQANVVLRRLPTVLGDDVALTQLLQNLIGNGIKYHGDESPEVVVSSERRDDAWEIRVADNGIGVAAEYQQTIFEPFRRLHTQLQFEGSGIGLATCKRVVEQHGGEIWLESSPGCGATVCFTLPAVGVWSGQASSNSDLVGATQP